MPAAGARVQLVDAAGVVAVDDSLTDDGTLAADVDPGDFNVKVSLLDLVTARTDVTIGVGEEVEVTLNLPRLTASK